MLATATFATTRAGRGEGVCPKGIPWREFIERF
ncbi:MAG: hypothetical protein ACJAZX_000444 [Rickettsiales bacterium]|jgi:hypothetical protein